MFPNRMAEWQTTGNSKALIMCDRARRLHGKPSAPPWASYWSSSYDGPYNGHGTFSASPIQP